MNELDEHINLEGVTGVLANLEAKLYDAKQKNPDRDYKEQERIMSILSDLKKYVVYSITEREIIYERLNNTTNKHTKLTTLYLELQKDYKKVLKENVELKKNIP